MSNYLPRSHSGYQPLAVPLPAAEDRLYPSLEERDHRVLPPPVDAPIHVAAVQPSAPVYGYVHQPSQARPAFANAALPMQVSQPGYVALPNEGQVGPLAHGAGQASPAPASASASSQPFISNSVVPPPTISLLEERIKGASRAQLSLQAMFNHSWRFFTKNFGSFCGTQLCILVSLFFVVAILIVLVEYTGLANTFRHHASRGNFIIFLAIEFVVNVLIVFPLFLALTHATIKAIQQNRFLYFDQFFGYFGLHYCNFFGFCFLNSLLLIPLSFLSIFGSFIYLFLFSFAAIFKFQFPEMSTFKAWGLSIRISAKNWPKIALLSFLILLMNVFALFAFGVGLFITIPLTIAVKIYTYHKLVGLHTISGYNNMEGRTEEYAYDATGLNPDMPMPPQQLQPHQAHYIQLVPMQMPMPMTMRTGNNGVPMPMLVAVPGSAMMMPHMAPRPAYPSAGVAQSV